MEVISKVRIVSEHGQKLRRDIVAGLTYKRVAHDHFLDLSFSYYSSHELSIFVYFHLFSSICVI